MNDLRLKFAAVSVLVVGDVMLDEYLFGNVNRISPEAPVPVVDVKKRRYLPGGAANVAANIRSLGAGVKLAGVCGDDRSGDLLRQSLSEAGIGAELICAISNRVTTSKTRVMAGQQQIVRFDHEERRPVDGEAGAGFGRTISEALRTVPACVLSDYGKGLLTAGLCQQLIRQARQLKVPSIADPKGRDYSKYLGCSLITPNQKEAGEATGITIETDSDLSEAGKRLLGMLPGTAVLITRGADGMTLFRAGHGPLTIPTVAQEVFDVVGAGDTVIAALSVALGARLSLEIAIQLANIAGGIAVGKHGTVAVKLDELLERSETSELWRAVQ